MEREGKRIRLSVEPHAERKIYETTGDGKETAVIETSAAERFTRLVRQIDFQRVGSKEEEEEVKEREDKDRSLSEKKDKSASAAVSSVPPKWPWSNVSDELVYARMEIDQLVTLIDMVTGKDPQVGIWNIPKPSPSLGSYYNEMMVRQKSKQKELVNAASILSQGSKSLRDMVTREKTFFEDLLKIRGKWLLTTKPPSARKGAQMPSSAIRQIGKLFVDYGYKLVGSQSKAEAELIQTPTGKVSVVFPSSASVSKSLQLYTTPSRPYQDQLRPLRVNESDDFGKTLSDAQRVYFLNELFQQLRIDALQKADPSVEVLSSQITLEHDSRNNLNIVLKPVDEGIVGASLQGEGTADVGSVADCVPFAVFEIILHQLLRKHHIASFKKYEMPSSSKDQAKEGAPSGILDNVFMLYRHFCLYKQIDSVLDRISQALPQLSVHWYSTDKFLTSSFGLSFGRRFCIKVIINRTSISLSGPSWAAINTAEDLGKAILYKLLRHIVDETYKDAVSFGYKTRRDGFTVSFSGLQKSVTVTFSPTEDYSIDISLSESVGGMRETSKKLSWDMMPGDTVESKLKFLFSGRRDAQPTAVSGVEELSFLQSPKQPQNGYYKSPPLRREGSTGLNGTGAKKLEAIGSKDPDNGGANGIVEVKSTSPQQMPQTTPEQMQVEGEDDDQDPPSKLSKNKKAQPRRSTRRKN